MTFCAGLVLVCDVMGLHGVCSLAFVETQTMAAGECSLLDVASTENMPFIASHCSAPILSSPGPIRTAARGAKRDVEAQVTNVQGSGRTRRALATAAHQLSCASASGSFQSMSSPIMQCHSSVTDDTFTSPVAIRSVSRIRRISTNKLVYSYTFGAADALSSSSSHSTTTSFFT